MTNQLVELFVGRLFYDSVPKFFKPDNIQLSPGNICVVNTEFGLDLAKILKKFVISEEKVNNQFYTVVRLATREDLEINKKNEEESKKFFRICLDEIKESGLQIKLVKTHFLLDRSKLLIFFMSEKRVDFRKIVKRFASNFNLRVEMRQLLPRQETSFVGGFGICGKEYCCIKIRKIFDNISIKMAKAQNLDINTAKIIGACGKLLCCLSFEYENYINK